MAEALPGETSSDGSLLDENELLELELIENEQTWLGCGSDEDPTSYEDLSSYSNVSYETKLKTVHRSNITEAGGSHKDSNIDTRTFTRPKKTNKAKIISKIDEEVNVSPQEQLLISENSDQDRSVVEKCIVDHESKCFMGKQLVTSNSPVFLINENTCKKNFNINGSLRVNYLRLSDKFNSYLINESSIIENVSFPQSFFMNLSITNVSIGEKNQLNADINSLSLKGTYKSILETFNRFECAKTNSFIPPIVSTPKTTRRLKTPVKYFKVDNKSVNNLNSSYVVNCNAVNNPDRTFSLKNDSSNGIMSLRSPGTPVVEKKLRQVPTRKLSYTIIPKANDVLPTDLAAYSSSSETLIENISLPKSFCTEESLNASTETPENRETLQYPRTLVRYNSSNSPNSNSKSVIKRKDSFSHSSSKKGSVSPSQSYIIPEPCLYQNPHDSLTDNQNPVNTNEPSPPINDENANSYIFKPSLVSTPVHVRPPSKQSARVLDANRRLHDILDNSDSFNNNLQSCLNKSYDIPQNSAESKDGCMINMTIVVEEKDAFTINSEAMAIDPICNVDDIKNKKESPVSNDGKIAQAESEFKTGFIDRTPNRKSGIIPPKEHKIIPITEILPDAETIHLMETNSIRSHANLIVKRKSDWKMRKSKSEESILSDIGVPGLAAIDKYDASAKLTSCSNIYSGAEGIPVLRKAPSSKLSFGSTSCIARGQRVLPKPQILTRLTDKSVTQTSFSVAEKQDGATSPKLSGNLRPSGIPQSVSRIPRVSSRIPKFSTPLPKLNRQK